MNDNEGHYTCDCVVPSDPCLSDRECQVAPQCPDANGQELGEEFWDDSQVPDHLLVMGRPINWWLGATAPQERALEETRRFSEVN